MATNYKRRFRNYLVNKSLQLHLLGQSLIYMTVIVIVTVGIVLYPLIHDMIFLNDMGRQYQAAQTLLTLAKWLVPAVLILYVLFVAHMIVVTHRVCGPLVNFTHTFNKLAEGDLTRTVHLRDRDYLKSECERINQMIKAMSGIITRLMADHNKLMVTLQDLKGQVGDLDTREKVETTLEMIRKDAEYVADTLSHFTVENPRPER
jgi:nitrogen fixation/metabolism regulation signal transduction histidine kinase